jgi:hypothetical protein
MGGGEKTGVIFPLFRKSRVLVNMPDGIGGIAVEMAPGNEFQAWGAFRIGIAVVIPPEKLIPVAGGGNPLQNLQKIHPHPGASSVAGKGVDANHHTMLLYRSGSAAGKGETIIIIPPLPFSILPLL